MLYLADSLDSLISKGELVPVIAILGGLSVGVIAIVFTSIKSICIAKAREETKRELAAYVAEGTLDPDKAVAMIDAGRPKGEGGCCGKVT